ncbi:helix-turn-helix domain-containing protein [Roseococcus sp. SDR]|uniref:LexA family transcriptional regulator n=1 Tax=Roseococcus sp. SDR TaxID=2835532 RepID=UPI001BCE2B4F|nr:XRE family transcriptional regulator [Roseococcus sp. SDR]MBS7790275.1 helix-turn-helix transcriptional regulator [Roseococcus sp. SDR]MBV1845589.1 helix-turn-helix domain-containing protein [Roseococcus sp. SDR]
MDTPAERLRRFREDKGIGSGAELARRANIPEATYRAYEAGRRPLTARAAQQLAAILECPWQRLLFGKDDAAETAEEASVALGQRVSRRPIPPPPVPRAEVVDVAGQPVALIPLYDAKASAGHGADVDGEVVLYRVPFREEWVRGITQSPLEQLALVKVDGDSMEPTLRQGDKVLVDFGQTRPGRKDGIYVLRSDDGLQVKRIQTNLASRTLSILSDNPLYEPLRDIQADMITVIGRVIWLGRQVGS